MIANDIKWYQMIHISKSSQSNLSKFLQASHRKRVTGVTLTEVYPLPWWTMCPWWRHFKTWHNLSAQFETFWNNFRVVVCFLSVHRGSTFLESDCNAVSRFDAQLPSFPASQASIDMFREAGETPETIGFEDIIYSIVWYVKKTCVNWYIGECIIS